MQLALHRRDGGVLLEGDLLQGLPQDVVTLEQPLVSWGDPREGVVNAIRSLRTRQQLLGKWRLVDGRMSFTGSGPLVDRVREPGSVTQRLSSTVARDVREPWEHGAPLRVVLADPPQGHEEGLLRHVVREVRVSGDPAPDEAVHDVEVALEPDPDGVRMTLRQPREVEPSRQLVPT